MIKSWLKEEAFETWEFLIQPVSSIVLSSHSEHLFQFGFFFHFVCACQNFTSPCKTTLLSVTEFKCYSKREIKYIFTGHSSGSAGELLCCSCCKCPVEQRPVFGSAVDLCVCWFCVNSCPELSISCRFVTWSLHHVCCVIFRTKRTYGFAVLPSCWAIQEITRSPWTTT